MQINPQFEVLKFRSKLQKELRAIPQRNYNLFFEKYIELIKEAQKDDFIDRYSKK